MRSTYDRSILNRMIGIARFEARAYNDVAMDKSATAQAALVVVIASVSSGLGSIDDDGLGGVIAGIFTGLIAWIVLSLSAYVIGTQFFGAPAARIDTSALIRSIGFAYAPLTLSLFGIMPFFGSLVVLGLWIWWIATSLVAVRRTVEIGVSASLITVIGAMITTAIIALIAWAITGISII